MTAAPAPALVRDDGSPTAGRVARLRANPEEGAQAVEYAMIGGLGAGLIGLLWTLISKTGMFDKLLEALIRSLVQLLTGWF